MTTADAVGIPALVGLAHGSRHPEVPAAVADLMAAVAQLAAAQGTPLRAEPAFLDLTAPDLATVCAQLAADGVRRAVVVPLLFTSAFHATVDVPEAVRESAAAAGLTLDTAAILGTGDDVLDVLEQALDAAGVRASRVLLFAVGSSSEPANDAVADLGARLGARRGIEVVTAFGTRAPRGRDQLDRLGADGAVLPLFCSPGLLLDPLAAACAERGLSLVPPLGPLLAPLVLQRSAVVPVG
ncbi:MAG: sirohydrochlorin chelatase [Propionibacteriaceae bacterium]